MPRSSLVALALAATLLAGCGGGGGDDRPATIDMSGSAATTAAGATSEAATTAEATDAGTTEEVATDEATDGETAATEETATGTDAAVDPSTVTVDLDPFTVQADDAERPPFPAESAAGVVALAMQRPPGRIVYDVAFPQGAYRLTLANDGTNATLHQSQDTGDVWIGASVENGTISWFCTALAGGTPDCRKGDPDGNAILTAREIALVVGSEFIQTTFGAVADLPEMNVGQDEQVGKSVSCMAATVQGEDLRLCSTEEGYVTEITAGTTKALASEVSSDVPASDLEPPAEPQ